MNSDDTQKSNGDEKKREPASYPYSSLIAALKIADAVKNLGGARVKIQKSVLASHLKESEKSAAFQQRLNGAKAFGIIEGRKAYVLSAAGQRYYFPTTESEKSSALLELLSAPEAFKQLINRFNGAQLPSREILANILHRELRVPDSWKERVAASFENSARFAGALDETGFLRYSASKEQILLRPQFATNIDTMESDKRAISGPEQPIRTESRTEQPLESNVWNFVYKGKAVRLVTPTELDESLWEKLNAYVQLLNPTPEKQK